MEIFKHHPNLKEAYKTSDGQHFYQEDRAKLHAKSLEDKKIEHLINPGTNSTTADTIDWSKKTKDEISVELEKREIDFDPKMKKADLILLLEGGEKSDEGENGITGEKELKDMSLEVLNDMIAKLDPEKEAATKEEALEMLETLNTK